jgi:Putative Flp pilus-assembly TadE/G-like
MGEWIMSSRTSSRIFRRLFDLQRDRRGNVTVMMGFLLPPLIGTFGLGFEVANWYLTTRSMQNAADSAAVAIATTAGTNYLTEARAVAAQYGFVNGVNNVTVAASNAAACPGGGTSCYSVTITQTLPLFLSQIIGYAGNAILNQTNAQQQTSSVAAQQLTSTAVASQSSIQVPLCLLALGTSGAQDIVTNGNPHANMSGCSVMANTSARCNGGNLGAPYGLAHVTDSGCGVIQVSGVPTVADGYASLASNIPSDALGSCGGSFPQVPTHHGDPALPSSNVWTAGSRSLSGNVVVCGDLQLNGDVTIDAPAGAVLIVENGQLDLNGFTLRTSSGSGLTVVFSGSNGSYTHAPSSSVNNSGTIDIAAPTSGPWSGIAVYQDPNLTTGVNLSAAGNAPTWDISGLVYMPHSNVTLSGAINKSSNGQACFVLVMDSITINGTGDVLSNNTPANCSAAGVNLPHATIPGRGQLVS